MFGVELGLELGGAFENQYDTALGMAKKHGKSDKVVHLLMSLGAPDSNH
jgi:hypothetical protein